ncbi:MAG: hypothetical protein DHS20C21_01160 [Gemmatimonadota bacterium]|nr:MAG: hypothetical protein DHS20C21_01160 [Gemmatimonadota bacterium]
MHRHAGTAHTGTHHCRFDRGATLRSLLISTAVAFLLTGCADNDPLSIQEEPPPPRDTTSPAVVVQSHETALATLDLDLYTALLEAPSGRAEGFRFIPQADDVLGWLPPSGWDYDLELRTVGHMMDPEFVSEYTHENVDSIEVAMDLLNERVMDDGGVEVTCTARITVLWGPDDGGSSDVRLVFTMFPDADGFLRIRTIAELPAFTRLPAFSSRDAVPPGDDARGVDDVTWGFLKGLHR